MKILSIILFTFLFTDNLWLLDINKAETQAKENHKMILINFSGSDWCGPCIRTHREIFEKDAFTSYAKENLVLVRADFPRLKKNQLTPEQFKKNNDLALKYNPDGDFPLTLLLDANGKVIKEWKGFPDVSPEEFVKQIESAKN
jgi:thioredoxin-related protein